MVKTFLLLLVIFFAVLGISESICFVKILQYFPGKRFKTYTVVTLKSGYALRQLEFIWRKICWYGEGYSNGIIAIIDHIDEQEIAMCNNYIKNKNIVICNKCDVYKNIDSQGEF